MKLGRRKMQEQQQLLYLWFIVFVVVFIGGSFVRDLFAQSGGREVVVGAKGEGGKVFEREVQAVFVGAYDGDTLTVNIPQWPTIIGRNMGVRIAGIDTPEIRGTDGYEKNAAEAAKAFVNEVCRGAPGKALVLRNLRRDKYFRILADVECGGVNLGAELLRRQLAVPYDGGRKGAWK